MLTLIEQAEVYAPAPLGVQDVLIANDKILALGDISLPDSVDINVIDGRNNMLIPGLIDGHVHITGGGGEGGYHTRTPELELSRAVSAGVTTVVGVLGTDGTSRTLPDLIAKAHALENEGISCYALVGNYHIPVNTVTGKIEDDLMLIDRLIGVGEIAISDHRSSQPTRNELAKLASSARIGGMLSGKSGIVTVHVGAGEGKLSPLTDLVEHTDLPINMFCPTHLNRSNELFLDALNFADQGGFLDFTTSTIPQTKEDQVLKASTAVRRALDYGVSSAQITMTSDGQGSLPKFNEDGSFTGLGIGRIGSLYEAFVDCMLTEKISVESALRTVTKTPAELLKLPQKGEIAAGKDADLVLTNKDWQIDTVFSRGKLMMREGTAVVKGTFE
ncbi:beta-aspartyl-peptidase [Salisediminibacterium halotolerans]|uniref:beta-aspartyl-peptidase n=1 Tax=Salisediminibacterium halotolerans TaxID=517425 RepID=UPI000EB561D9|nr:beta-aspartyl-peptidase [Salisediminibacterium halotolerans]RLJ78257.1 beta-aspartyl-dipeptidase (metallo-type) [Actinophytocola xinjiangensis]RPE88404.1 beta-aspartyl-dipeptidase (metallo-type) [Salisediminibacterium halotolerans]TWG37234.1 beta-aspartyl-dipeptidase (metallo-type) [Salisediminibacterium halotolerans]GEL07714.1 isoaspartyl dipeptidase [Salisediminibacterium halotolerans]